MLLDFLSNNILGIIEDNWPSFAIGYLFKQNPGLYFEQLGYPHGYYLIPSFNEPFSQIPFLLSALYINEILAFNLFIIVTFLLNIFFGYKFFKLFNKTQIIAVILSIIFAFSPYFRYQSRSHPDLIQFWPLFILFGLAINATLNIKNSIKIGTLLYIASCFTNYLGFFGFLISNLILLVRLIQQKIAIKYSLKLLFIQNFVYLILFSATIYITYIKLPQIIKPQTNAEIASITALPSSDISRNIEDFFYFSLRPWYFITPPPENPITGHYAKSFIEILQTRWGHWLTFDYFPSEHSAAFLGFTNILLAIVGIKFLLNKSHPNSQQNKKLLIVIITTIIFIILMTLPPYIPIAGIKIYTPNYLLFLTFNIFRTTARFGVINLAFVLILVGYGYQYLANHIKSKYILGSVIIFLFVIQLFEFWSPIRVINISNTPQVYTSIASQTERNIAIYPYSRTIDTAFWIRVHNKNIINTHALKYGQFDSKKFTGGLTKCQSVNELLNVKAELLVYFNNSDKNRNMAFFDDIPFLQKIDTIQVDQNKKTFKNFFINYYDMDNPDNSAVIYKVIKQNGVVDNYCNNNE